MPIRERIDAVDRIRQWEDAIPLHYEYTAGVVGEKFLRGLAEGKLLAGYCPSCKETSLPPRMYCVKCYGPIKRFVEVEPHGSLAAVTSSETETFAFVVFEGVRGGILHRVIGDSSLGDRVKPRFKPRRQRTGSILDLEGFQRVASRRRRAGSP